MFGTVEETEVTEKMMAATGYATPEQTITQTHRAA